MNDDEPVAFTKDKREALTDSIADTTSTWNLLIVDDDEAVHEITRLVLKNVNVLGKGLTIYSAYSAQQARELIHGDIDFSFAIIDVVMETDKAGLDLIKWIRNNEENDDIRLVLRTGQPGNAPEKDIIIQYDIHDYKEKSELTAKKLFTLSFSCLRAYRDIVKAKEMVKMLRHSEKMDIIGQLTSGIAHDFNNILGVILANSELLQQIPPHTEKQLKKIRGIEKAAAMGGHLTQKLRALTISEVEEKSNVNINHIISSMDVLICNSDINDIDIKYELNDDIWLTNINTADFEAALFNLLINAKHATSDNGLVTITTDNCTIDSAFCKLHPNASKGEYVHMSVADNGKGMSEDIKRKIFEPFFTTKQTGTGLGLAMVFEFINRSSGYIAIDSEEGVGTNFHIYLPKAMNE